MEKDTEWHTIHHFSPAASTHTLHLPTLESGADLLGKDSLTWNHALSPILSRPRLLVLAWLFQVPHLIWREEPTVWGLSVEDLLLDQCPVFKAKHQETHKAL